MTHSISLRSDFELPSKAWSFRKQIRDNMTVTAESVCMGQARKLCSDIEAALEYGAFPAAHALMIDRIKDANENKVPLSCVLSLAL